ncbi:hypothetical protein HJ172_04170 [Vibrio parahaemolyticus]|nr:hypothetical protein [Vibrio parahaemolyticus]MBE3845772.1 hypothetical protein [Vibrio parahaemolyticus]HCE3228305.1 hypothetical protein [Vibrio parahaemolyticus]HCG7987428.1 hypothetical protein [Vibrio parahaemolyticus]
MIAKFKGSKAWNAYMAYLGFILHLPRARTMRIQGLVDHDQAKQCFTSLDAENKKTVIMDLMEFQRIDYYDMMALVAVHENKHGMSIDASSIDNYELPELAEMVLETLVKCSTLKDAGLFF